MPCALCAQRAFSRLSETDLEVCVPSKPTSRGLLARCITDDLPQARSTANTPSSSSIIAGKTDSRWLAYARLQKIHSAAALFSTRRRQSSRHFLMARDWHSIDGVVAVRFSKMPTGCKVIKSNHSRQLNRHRCSARLRSCAWTTSS